MLSLLVVVGALVDVVAAGEEVDSAEVVLGAALLVVGAAEDVDSDDDDVVVDASAEVVGAADVVAAAEVVGSAAEVVAAASVLEAAATALVSAAVALAEAAAATCCVDMVIEKGARPGIASFQGLANGAVHGNADNTSENPIGQTVARLGYSGILKTRTGQIIEEIGTEERVTSDEDLKKYGGRQ